MRVRIDNGRNYIWSIGDPIIKSLNVKTRVIVAVDPSKSNMAVMIGTLSGQELMLLEFCGNTDDKVLDQTMDTTDYTIEVSFYMRELLKDTDVAVMGIEQHILKKAMKYFNSMTVLTEIRASLIHLGLALNNKKPWEINNSAWKGAILPDGYRGHGEKGSQRFLREENYKYIDYTDDATDVICLYRFMVRELNRSNSVMIQCDAVEESTGTFSMYLVARSEVLAGSKEFLHNHNYSLLENAIYFSNRSTLSGFCNVRADTLTIDEIYDYGKLILPGDTVTLYVVKN